MYPYRVRYHKTLLFWVKNKKIRDHIEARVHEMMNVSFRGRIPPQLGLVNSQQEGLLKEVFLLKERLLSCHKYVGLLQGIAYKEFIGILENKTGIEDISQEELKLCIENLRDKTFQYSKRQEKYIKRHIVNRGLEVNILDFDGEEHDNQELKLLEFGVVSDKLHNKFCTQVSTPSINSPKSKKLRSSWERSILARAFEILDDSLR